MNNNHLTTDVVILGAGIGGYETFRTLAKLLKRRGLNKKITIVDQNNYFTFTPMLHEVASGSIEPQHAAIPLRELVYKTPHTFLKATIQKIDPQEKIIFTSQGELRYEFCVIAMGSGVNYFNTPGAEENCYGVRTLPEAMRLHEEIFHQLECQNQGELTFTVVGGGFTGVEVAGQLMYLVNHDLKKLYPEKRISVNLIEAGETLLRPLPSVVQKRVAEYLIKMGVAVHTNYRIQKIEHQKLIGADGQEIRSNFIIWSAGVKNVADKFLEVSLCEKGMIPVNEFLQHKQISSLYAVGDIALSFNPGSQTPQPSLGEAAHKEGQYVAKHILASLEKKSIKPFYFKSLGTLMPIGDWYGVALIGPIILFGKIAWWIRRTVYVLFMPGIIRKLKIVIDWTLHGFGFRYTLSIERKNNH